MKRFLPVLIILAVFIALFIFSPDVAQRSSVALWDYFKEMALIMPPVFLLMGFMEVWLPKQNVQKWLGKESGFKGGVLSLILGTLPTGPLYVAFPMTAGLLRKGASITNMVIFLGSWAALKIPQLMVEIKFLGLSFTLVRFSLTLLALVVIGFIMELLLKHDKEKAWMQSTLEEVPMKQGMGMKR
ncbi:MAG: permease [Sphaerochaeta sp.]